MIKDLHKKSAYEMLWSTLGHSGTNAVQVVTTIVLVRVLTPYDFGLMATVLIPLYLAKSMLWQGIGSPIVQQKTLPIGLTESIFFLSTLIGIMLTTLIITGAYFAEFFFAKYDIFNVFRWSAPIYIIIGVGTVSQALLLRNLDMRKRSHASVIASIISGVCAIAFAMQLPNVYSLVVQHSIFMFVMTLLHIWYAQWKPIHAPSKILLRKNSHIMCTETISRLVQYCSFRIDQCAIAIFLGPVALGYYDTAFRISQTVFGIIKKIIYDIIFPLFAKLQGNAADSTKTLLRSTQIIQYAVLPLGICLIFYAPIIVHVFFGLNWEPVIPLVRIFGILGFAESITLLWNRFLAGSGKPAIAMYMEMYRAIALFIVVNLAIPHGINSIALVVAGVAIGMHVPYLRVLQRYVDIKIYIFVPTLLPSIFAASGMLATYTLLAAPVTLPAAIMHATTVAIVYSVLLIVGLRLQKL